MVTVAEIVWEVTKPAYGTIAPIEAKMNEAQRKENREALRLFLCQYFNSDRGDCTHHIEKSIAPVGVAGSRKKLKVRWALPGSGKRGGLRLAIVVDCKARHVWIAGAWPRKDEPSDEDFDSAFESAEEW